MTPPASSPPLAAILRLQQSVFESANAQLESFGLSLASSLDTVERAFDEAVGSLERATDGPFRDSATAACIAITQLFVVRAITESYTRSGPLCAAQLATELAPVGAALLSGMVTRNVYVRVMAADLHGVCL